MPILFTPLAFPNFTLQNRLVVSPMCQYSAQDGFANDWHLMHLGQFAAGKAGAIIQEATAVSPEGRISDWDLGLWKDEHIEKYKQITDFIKSQGSIAGIQLAHAGRKASSGRPWGNKRTYQPDEEHGWQTVAPSATPFHSKDPLPKALSISEIKELIAAFQSAALRAVKAGYQIIEIHAAHGYLIHQFLSPLVNQRTDEYGGSFENRTRFLLEIIDEIKDSLRSQSLWVRVSATDWAAGGWDIEQTVALAKLLKERGVAIIDVSTGGAVRHQQIPVEPGYQVPFAQQIKAEANIATAAVGLIQSGTQAEEILQHKKADLIMIGRAFLENPHFVYQCANELQTAINWADQYQRAKK